MYAYATAPKPAQMSATEGCAAVCFRANWTGVSPEAHYLVSGTNNAAPKTRFFYSNSAANNTISTYNGTNVSSVATTYSPTVRECYRTSWSVVRNCLKIDNLTTGATSGCAGFASWGQTFDANLLFGMPAVGASVEGFISNIKVDNSPDGCL
jgi:hypothetical protein